MRPVVSHPKSAHHSQSARGIKGVDLRSTAGNCAWVQTSWLTLSRVQPHASHLLQVRYMATSLCLSSPHGHTLAVAEVMQPAFAQQFHACSKMPTLGFGVFEPRLSRPQRRRPDRTHGWFLLMCLKPLEKSGFRHMR